MKESHGTTAEVVEVYKEIFSFGLGFVGFFELDDGWVVENMLIKSGWCWGGIICGRGCVGLVEQCFTKFVDV